MFTFYFFFFFSITRVLVKTFPVFFVYTYVAALHKENGRVL